MINLKACESSKNVDFQFRKTNETAPFFITVTLNIGAYFYYYFFHLIINEKQFYSFVKRYVRCI